MSRRIVLASSSKYRREILARIGLTHTCDSPNIDETPRVDETAAELVARLSAAKAAAVAARHPDALIIGSDQAGQLPPSANHKSDATGNAIIGKPRDHLHAVRQLQAMSAATLELYSGVALLDARNGDCQTAVENYSVTFRQLDDALINRYLTAEQPYQCCGSLKAEGMGIALLKKIRGDDPNALLGLPVIRLVDMLKAVGVELI